ncbi:MAG: methyltransferase [Bryobacteraceae bacterium]
MASAYFDSCVLFAASDLGIFTALAEFGEATSQTIAGHLALDSRAVGLLLDGCVAVGLLKKSGDLFRNTVDSDAFLVRGKPGDLSGALLYNRDVYSAWGKLKELVRNGLPAESPNVHLGDDAERTRNFVLSMHHRALSIGRVVVSMLDLSGCRSLLDVGGGPGTYSVMAARNNPGLRCIVLDLPPITRIADELISQQGFSERVITLSGDYHNTPFPPGQDAVHFFGMLHQEPPEAILDLFHRAWRALKPGGVIHIMDMMTDSTHTAPKFSALFAVNMALTTHNGWVFADSELCGWLTETGFTEFRVQALPAPMPHCLASARKPLD